jgi:hypothetical protein
MGEWRYGSTILYLGTKVEESGQTHVPATFNRGKAPAMTIRQEVGWEMKTVWTLRRKEKSVASTESRTPTVQPVARRCAD